MLYSKCIERIVFLARKRNLSDTVTLLAGEVRRSLFDMNLMGAGMFGFCDGEPVFAAQSYRSERCVVPCRSAGGDTPLPRADGKDHVES